MDGWNGNVESRGSKLSGMEGDVEAEVEAAGVGSRQLDWQPGRSSDRNRDEQGSCKKK